MENENLRSFEAAWEVEYLCARIKMIEDCVKNKNYSKAYSLLSMIQEKSRNAEFILDAIVDEKSE